MDDAKLQARVAELAEMKSWHDVKAAAEAAGFEDKPVTEKSWTDEENLIAIAKKEFENQDLQNMANMIEAEDEPEEEVVEEATPEPAPVQDEIKVNPLKDLMVRNGMMVCEKCGDQAQTGTDGFVCTRSLKKAACPQLKRNGG